MSTTITAFESVTLDGVLQGPGRPDEDTRDGFTEGGWGNGFTDDVLMQFLGAGMQSPGALLFGHRTYTDLMNHWTSVGTPNPFTERLVKARKYVVSRSADVELKYPNSTLLAGDATETVERLRREGTLPIQILGSGELVRTLHRAGLIDRYTLLVHPIVMGSGRRLFGDADRVDLTLEQALPTTTGVVIVEYSVNSAAR